MRNKLLIMGIGVLVLSVIVLTVIITTKKNYVDTSFATEITLKYHYIDKKIDLKITDENDIQVIKENLKGISYADNPSCGFSLDISITLSDGQKSIVLCPACDSCAIARIGDSSRYIKMKDRKAFEAVLEKYGFLFPCV